MLERADKNWLYLKQFCWIQFLINSNYFLEVELYLKHEIPSNQFWILINFFFFVQKCRIFFSWQWTPLQVVVTHGLHLFVILTRILSRLLRAPLVSHAFSNKRFIVPAGSLQRSEVRQRRTRSEAKTRRCCSTTRSFLFLFRLATAWLACV